ncbi:MAG TPA: adenine deaminase [Lachnospiraceae bacterium]|nr:adenine deaminase [Lachnospiraceae bacterium]
MKTLLKNGNVLNVFTDTIEKLDVLIEDKKIIGLDYYSDSDADEVIDLDGKFVCPGFIDGHIHIESTMLTPSNLAKICLKHGTTSIIADPHEIANVSGLNGINYMLQASKGLPMNVYLMASSCVPSTSFDEAGAILRSQNLLSIYDNKRILGLAEMMNYPGVLSEDADVLKKIEDSIEAGKVVDGHAPLLSGKDLDKYISKGVSSEHECTSWEEGLERIRKGQWLMIREGTAAKNLEALLPAFDEPYNKRCLLVTDDKHPADLINEGHIDSIIKKAAKLGKSPAVAIRMASLQAAQRFELSYRGAIAPGYVADIIIADNIDNLNIIDVYRDGKKVVENGEVLPFAEPVVEQTILDKVCKSFNLAELSAEDFAVLAGGPANARIIKVIPGQIITDQVIESIDLNTNSGIDVDRDILKLAVIERHHNTGHIGLGFIKGLGLKGGAIASSVSHDSHNLIVVGTNDKDMAIAANEVKNNCGGNVVVKDGKVVSMMPLPVGGLMSDKDVYETAKLNKEIRDAAASLGANEGIEAFMNMAFVSLPVIPHLKMTTTGLVDVDEFKKVSLFVE